MLLGFIFIEKVLLYVINLIVEYFIIKATIFLLIHYICIRKIINWLIFPGQIKFFQRLVKRSVYINTAYEFKFYFTSFTCIEKLKTTSLSQIYLSDYSNILNTLKAIIKVISAYHQCYKLQFLDYEDKQENLSKRESKTTDYNSNEFRTSNADNMLLSTNLNNNDVIREESNVILQESSNSNFKNSDSKNNITNANKNSDIHSETNDIKKRSTNKPSQYIQSFIKKTTKLLNIERQSELSLKLETFISKIKNGEKTKLKCTDLDKYLDDLIILNSEVIELLEYYLLEKGSFITQIKNTLFNDLFGNDYMIKNEFHLKYHCSNYSIEVDKDTNSNKNLSNSSSRNESPDTNFSYDSYFSFGFVWFLLTKLFILCFSCIKLLKDIFSRIFRGKNKCDTVDCLLITKRKENKSTYYDRRNSDNISYGDSDINNDSSVSLKEINTSIISNDIKNDISHSQAQASQKHLIIICSGNGSSYEIIHKSTKLIDYYISFYNSSSNNIREVHVLLFNYRGYGLSTGTPSLSNIKIDSETVLNHFKKQNIYSSISVHGISIGGLCSGYLFSKGLVGLCVLDRTFSSLYNVVFSFKLGRYYAWLLTAFGYSKSEMTNDMLNIDKIKYSNNNSGYFSRIKNIATVRWFINKINHLNLLFKNFLLNRANYEIKNMSSSSDSINDKIIIIDDPFDSVIKVKSSFKEGLLTKLNEDMNIKENEKFYDVIINIKDDKFNDEIRNNQINQIINTLNTMIKLYNRENNFNTNIVFPQTNKDGVSKESNIYNLKEVLFQELCEDINSKNKVHDSTDIHQENLELESLCSNYISRLLSIDITTKSIIYLLSEVKKYNKSSKSQNLFNNNKLHNHKSKAETTLNRGETLEDKYIELDISNNNNNENDINTSLSDCSSHSSYSYKFYSSNTRNMVYKEEAKINIPNSFKEEEEFDVLGDYNNNNNTITKEIILNKIQEIISRLDAGGIRLNQIITTNNKVDKVFTYFCYKYLKMNSSNTNINSNSLLNYISVMTNYGSYLNKENLIDYEDDISKMKMKTESNNKVDSSKLIKNYYLANAINKIDLSIIEIEDLLANKTLFKAQEFTNKEILELSTNVFILYMFLIQLKSKVELNLSDFNSSTRSERKDTEFKDIIEKSNMSVVSCGHNGEFNSAEFKFLRFMMKNLNLSFTS